MAHAEAIIPNARQLKLQLKVAERRGKLRALMLVAPLFLFVFISFVIPIVLMLKNAIYDPDISNNLPQTTALLADWDGKELPSEAVYAALAGDFRGSEQAKTSALIGKRMNYEIAGIRSKVITSARKAKVLSAPPYKDQIIAIDPIWSDIDTWTAIKRAGSPITSFYLLNTLDLESKPDGTIGAVDPGRAVYRDILKRTIGISLTVTLLTLILGFPVAYVLANTPARIANILMIFVLLPFWTSLLVRTTAWFVILQDNGLINDLLLGTGLVNHPLPLIFSRFGTIVAMTHIQLPFTLLPIYSLMKTIPPSYMRAARSLGGGPVYSFTRVYLPQTLPGIGAGCLLTFILCLGYYITPALVGGPSDQMVSGIIAEAINRENNWGKACALGTVLLTATLVLYFVYNRLVGIDKVKLG
ncbi:MAG: ABC transporter permease [Alphaproteobacteria bacterium]|nr:MAG: ABC transporter permease [Alphaproteobacteria bacterium]